MGKMAEFLKAPPINDFGDCVEGWKAHKVSCAASDGNYCTTALVKVKVKFTLEQATKAQRGCRGIALLIL
jgi:hypothetical protein